MGEQAIKGRRQTVRTFVIDMSGDRSSGAG
jgi:hypothetical protein